jgi:hypothetical protein
LAADAFTGTVEAESRNRISQSFETKEMTVVMAEQGANLAVTAKASGATARRYRQIRLSDERGPVKCSEGGPAARNHC